MTDSPTLGIALLGGLLSFISPCVLPLVPAYVSYLTSRAAQQVTDSTQTNRVGIFLHGVMFVLGFTVVFVVFGLLTNAGALLMRGQSVAVLDWLRVGGGVLVVLLGLHLMGFTGWLARRPQWKALGAIGAAMQKALEWLAGLLYADTRAQLNSRSPYGYLGSSLMGVIFAAGWSPCVGPILTSILLVAVNGSSSSSFSQVALLLTAYSLGLGIPFLLAAVALDSMKAVMKKIQRRMRLVEVISGVFLILLGVMLMTDTFRQIAQAGGGWTTFAKNLEGCVGGVFQGKLNAGQLGECFDQGAERFEPLSAGQALVLALPEVNPQLGIERGAQALPFETTLLDGTPLKLESLRGRVVLLNFWATWCAPCKAEMPDFDKLSKQYAPDQFIVLAVNFGENPAQINKFLETTPLSFSIGLDERGKISRQFAVSNYPTSLLIDQQGQIAYRQSGAFNLERLKAAIDTLLARGTKQ